MESTFIKIRNCSKTDFEQILSEITEFWGSDRTLHLHHPIFLYEFGNSAYVMKEGDKVIAYLFGFLSQTGPVGYVHLLGVRRSHQRRGLDTRIYDHFIEFARRNRCKELKAITTPTNLPSILFHKSIGMELMGRPIENEIPVVEHYSGPEKHAVVFWKKI